MTKRTQALRKTVNQCFNSNKFAEIMKLYRVNHRKASIRAAAVEIGISRSTLHAIEMYGRIPDLETYYKCCLWCKYNMEWFFNKNHC